MERALELSCGKTTSSQGASLSLGFPLVKWGHADHLSAQPFEEALIELAAGLLAWVRQYSGSTRTLL